MTDPWQFAARKARKDARHVVCGPAGAERDTIAAVFRRERKLAGVPPGSIARPVG